MLRVGVGDAGLTRERLARALVQPKVVKRIAARPLECPARRAIGADARKEEPRQKTVAHHVANLARVGAGAVVPEFLAGRARLVR
jgi:hypothetical protein